jgi:DNA (cytosine-5)-methyltransferase 1
MKQWEKGDKYHPNQSLFSLKRLAWDKPSRTVLKDQGVKNKACQCCHPTEHRRLTIPEIKRVSSFPDAYRFIGTTAEQWARIGNSVPPKFMQHIAENIYYVFLNPLDNRETITMPLDFVNKPINPTGPYKFKVISTFSGGGGSSLGCVWSGGKVLAAVEWDDNAVATYRLNFPNTPVIHRDIAKVTVEELLSLTGLQPRELDILDGSPPCQGFSTAGKRQLDDPRNSLFKEYVRLLRGLQPKVFVMENVSGMVKGNMKHVFAIAMRELKASGYQVKCQLMNAMYFGVPQSRERVIFIGVRNDLEIEPSHPIGANKVIPIRQALNELQLSQSDIELALLKETWQMYRVLHGKEKSKHFSLVRTSLDKPCPTLPKDTNSTTAGIIHPSEKRRFTIPEIKRLASFPDAFQLVGSFIEQWARIGNSVPPRFMESIATHIYTNILSAIPDCIGGPTHA